MSGEGAMANLRKGFPGDECIEGCNDILLRGSEIVLQDKSLVSTVFQYHPGKSPPDFRAELAKFLTSEYKDKVNSDDLVATTGASQGLQYIVTSIFQKDDVVFVEELSYYHGINLFKQLNMRVIPVRMDSEGIDVVMLEQLINEHVMTDHMRDKGRQFSSMAYLIPTFHNPTGISYSPERCQQLIKLARKYSILLVCDDVYNLLYYTDDGPQKRLLAYDNEQDTDYRGSVVSNCTFSKILAPGMRLGWIEAKPPIMNILLQRFVLQSGGCMNQYTSHIITPVLKEGLIAENLRRVREIYKRKMNKLLKSLQENLPSNCHIKTESKGGYFVWVTLPEGLDTSQMTVDKVDFMPGCRCSVEGKFTNAIRLSMSYCAEDLIAEGVARLCSAIRDKCQ